MAEDSNTTNHEAMMQRLSEGSYDLLEVKRVDESCYLILHLDGQMGTVFVGKDGKAKSYRHMRQIMGWLFDRFGIEKESIRFSEFPTGPTISL